MMQTLILVTAVVALVGGAVPGQVVTVESRGGQRPASNEVGTTEQGRPYIRYGASRSSGSWITTPGGVRVAVDEGIEWKGSKLFISLASTLVATPADSNDATWSKNVSAFWDQMGIEEYQPADGAKVEALALRSTRHRDLVEYRDLATGKRVGGTEAKTPGKRIPLLGSWNGERGARDTPTYQVVRSAAEWTTLHEALFKDEVGAPPNPLPEDFEKTLVVVVYRGRSSNCSGYSASAYVTKDATILRVHAHSYQTDGNPPPTWPYGVFAIPLRRGTDLILERNAQNLIGGPALWRTWKTWHIDG